MHHCTWMERVQQRTSWRRRVTHMRHLSGLLSLLVLCGVSLVLGIGLALQWTAGPARPLAPHSPGASVVQPTPAASGAMPHVVSIVVTPAQLAPLERATFATTFVNDGFRIGPYRATLELLPYSGGPLRSLTQRGFLLRHAQPLTIYWEWRAGASLPPSRYALRVLLSELASAARPLSTLTASRTLIVRPR